MTLKIILKGGEGSGHKGHSGRPGSVGGSVAGTGGDGRHESILSVKRDYDAPPLSDKLIEHIDTDVGPWDAGELAQEMKDDPDWERVGWDFGTYSKLSRQWTSVANWGAKEELGRMLKRNPEVRTMALYSIYSNEHGRPGQGSFPTFREWLDHETTAFRFGKVPGFGVTNFALSESGAMDAANAFGDKSHKLTLKNRNILGDAMTGIGEMYIDAEALSVIRGD